MRAIDHRSSMSSRSSWSSFMGLCCSFCWNWLAFQDASVLFVVGASVLYSGGGIARFISITRRTKRMSDLAPNTVIVHCDGIMCDEEIVLSLPVGWTGIVETGGYASVVYCPKPACQLQDAWFSSQCWGCVGTYSDCALGHSYLYANRRTITPEQVAVIRSGRCPVRTEGMVRAHVTSEGFQVDVGSDGRPACDVPGAGDAVADAIEAYIAAYPTVVG